jgi:serine/threonine protein kinase
LVKIGDFGEAMPMDANEEAPPLASPQFWSAPECFTGANYSVASEIYSMGMSLAEMLSGPFPYESYTREQLAERLADGKPALPPRHLAPAVHISDAMRRVLTKATRVKPADRYQSAQAMRSALLDAKIVDWSFPVVTDTSTAWSGKDMQGHDYRVTATKMIRKGVWRARAERRFPTGWRRVPQVAEVDDADELEAARPIFAAIDKLL